MKLDETILQQRAVDAKADVSYEVEGLQIKEQVSEIRQMEGGPEF
jgi:hypothetical protein